MPAEAVQPAPVMKVLKESLDVTTTAVRAFAGTACDLSRLIQSCGSDQAIALGALKEDLSTPVDVTTKGRLDQYRGAITRSRSFIDYRLEVPAWALIDFDTKGMPKEVSDRIDAAGGMWNALLTVAPELANAARVSRASTSAGLFHNDTGEPIAGSNGMHHYVLVRDARVPVFSVAERYHLAVGK
jgi:hypothetical protein